MPTRAGRTFFLPLILLPSFKTGERSPSSSRTQLRHRHGWVLCPGLRQLLRPGLEEARRAGRGEHPAHSSSDPVPTPAPPSAKRLCVCVPVLEIEAPGWAAWPRPLGREAVLRLKTRTPPHSLSSGVWCDPHCWGQCPGSPAPRAPQPVSTRPTLMSARHSPARHSVQSLPVSSIPCERNL